MREICEDHSETAEEHIHALLDRAIDIKDSVLWIEVYRRYQEER